MEKILRYCRSRSRKAKPSVEFDETQLLAMQQIAPENVLYVDSLEEKVKKLKRKMATFADSLTKPEPTPLFRAIHGGNSTDVSRELAPGKVHFSSSLYLYGYNLEIR